MITKNNMKWHYNIIKSIAGFYVAEVFYMDGEIDFIF